MRAIDSSHSPPPLRIPIWDLGGHCRGGGGGGGGRGGGGGFDSIGGVRMGGREGWRVEGQQLLEDCSHAESSGRSGVGGGGGVKTFVVIEGWLLLLLLLTCWKLTFQWLFSVWKWVAVNGAQGAHASRVFSLVTILLVIFWLLLLLVFFFFFFSYLAFGNGFFHVFVTLLLGKVFLLLLLFFVLPVPFGRGVIVCFCYITFRINPKYYFVSFMMFGKFM